jgi:hypothetical protein
MHANIQAEMQGSILFSSPESGGSGALDSCDPMDKVG